MKYTEKWVSPHCKSIKTHTYHGGLNPYIRHRDETYCSRTPWMQDYRNKLIAIDTDEKAAQAIREYWTWVAGEWNHAYKTTLA